MPFAKDHRSIDRREIRKFIHYSITYSHILGCFGCSCSLKSNSYVHVNFSSEYILSQTKKYKFMFLTRNIMPCIHACFFFSKNVFKDKLSFVNFTYLLLQRVL